MNERDRRDLFIKLYSAKTENEVDMLLLKYPQVFESANWHPLGGIENNFGVIENQQSSPIAALIEKITNSIDAVLMKKCMEYGIDPKSDNAPQSMDQAKTQFFDNPTSWDLPSYRKTQSQSIQIVADGPRKNTSLVICDNGEGQHPDQFENTFLSLLLGNKNEIHFVQGKYNMGGSGAIVFCGKKRYQLIGSKRFDNTGEFGFTLIREHPLDNYEEKIKKNTWYEYLKLDGDIPSFHTNELDLGLYNTNFTTGTVIKLYSYDLPIGSRSVISRDLNQSINEYLFEPVLPVITVDKKERYPDDRNLERDLYGLKRRLEQDDSRYVEEHFSDSFDDELFGKMKVTSYVFRTKMDDRSVKETKDSIRREFFKNNMSVLFSVNGQVHGHYTSEFITRSLKLNLLKDHLLIHVDCTFMNYDFRKELFMASRDRLKDGEETRALRSYLAEKLSDKDGRLAQIQKRRKDSISVESADARELLKSMARNFPNDSELLKLLDQSLNLDLQKKNNQNKGTKKKKKKKEKQPFTPNRFPAYFSRRKKSNDAIDIVGLPLGGEETVLFDTDVEDRYFDRIEEPGDLSIALLDYKSNNEEGGVYPGPIEQITDVVNARKSSPQQGTIKLHLNPTDKVNVGDAARIRVSLTDPAGEFDDVFWIKIKDQQKPKQPSKKKTEKKEPELSLPELILVHQEGNNGSLDWDKFSEGTSTTMDHATVMYPMVEGEKLDKIYINMDSTVLKDQKSKITNPNEEQLAITDNRYVATVYSHTILLYAITKAHKYKVVQEDDTDTELSIYLKDLFANYYAEFILNYGADEIMQLLEE